MHASTYTQVVNLVGRNADYYLLKWRSLEATNTLTSWNWAAFLWSPLWLAYRKMYVYAVLYWAISFAPDLCGSEEVSPFLDATLSLFLPLITGLFGNKMYYRSTLRKISRKQTSENAGPTLDVMLESQSMELVDDATVELALGGVAPTR